MIVDGWMNTGIDNREGLGKSATLCQNVNWLLIFLHFSVWKYKIQKAGKKPRKLSTASPNIRCHHRSGIGRNCRVIKIPQKARKLSAALKVRNSGIVNMSRVAWVKIPGVYVTVKPCNPFSWKQLVSWFRPTFERVKNWSAREITQALFPWRISILT